MVDVNSHKSHGCLGLPSQLCIIISRSSLVPPNCGLILIMHRFHDSLEYNFKLSVAQSAMNHLYIARVAVIGSCSICRWNLVVTCHNTMLSCRLMSNAQSSLLCNNHLFALCVWFALPGTRMFPPTLFFDGTCIEHCAFELRSLIDRLWQVSVAV